MIEVTLSPVTRVDATLSGAQGALSLAGSPSLDALLTPVLVASAGGGSSEFLTLTAGETIQSRRVVRSENGVLMAVDTAIPAHAQQIVGVSVGSAIAGQSVVVQRFGLAEETGWSWLPGVLFAGASGQLTQAPPATGWLLQVARVVAATRIDIDIEQPLAR